MNTYDDTLAKDPQEQPVIYIAAMSHAHQYCADEVTQAPLGKWTLRKALTG